MRLKRVVFDGSDSEPPTAAGVVDGRPDVSDVVRSWIGRKLGDVHVLHRWRLNKARQRRGAEEVVRLYVDNLDRHDRPHVDALCALCARRGR